jgi:Protein tyrosine phosphatase-like protein, PTPLA
MGIHDHVACMEFDRSREVFVLCTVIDGTSSTSCGVATVRLCSCQNITNDARYNLFFVLYPLGISSEMYEVYSAIPHAMKKNPLIGYILYTVLGVYFPGELTFYVCSMADS